MKRILFSVVLAAFAQGGLAQVKVSDAWVRATPSPQGVSGAFMKIHSAGDTRLVEVRSPVAGKVELHETSRDGDIVRMRPVPHVPVSAGAGAELKPGGYHAMLLDLRRQLKAGESVPLTLVFAGPDGKRETVEVKAPVRPLHGGHAGGHGH